MAGQLYVEGVCIRHVDLLVYVIDNGNIDA